MALPETTGNHGGAEEVFINGLLSRLSGLLQLGNKRTRHLQPRTLPIVFQTRILLKVWQAWL